MIAVLHTLAAAVGIASDHPPVAHQRVFKAVSDAVIVVDNGGMIVDANPAAERLHDRIPAARGRRLVGTRIDQRLRELTVEADPETEAVHARAWGSDVDLHIRVCRLFDRRGRSVGWTFVGRDITDLNRRQAELIRANIRLRTQLHMIEALRADLAEQAIRDPLTELYNRRHLIDQLVDIGHRPDTAGTPLSVAVIDIDHFKRINDHHGHPVGDQVLIQFARLLRRGIRPADLLARHGGEEFVLVMRETPLRRAWHLVESARVRISTTPLNIDGTTLRVSFSAGLACLPAGDCHTILLKLADEALYRAKRLGRDRVEAAVTTGSRAESGARPGMLVPQPGVSRVRRWSTR